MDDPGDLFEDIPTDLEIPENLPLNNILVRDFEKVANFQDPTYKIIEELIENLVKETDRYVEHILSTPDFELDENYLSQNLNNLKTLIETTFKLNKYKNASQNTKKKAKSNASNDPEFSLESLSYFQSNLNVPSLQELLRQEYIENQEFDRTSLEMLLKSNENYQYLKNICFVLKNPLDPFPDEDNEDDELKVSGGKIELRDPISMNYFTHPVTSKKCLHTYEESAIILYLDEGSQVCPINGCNSPLSINDLKFDKIMLLRTKAFLAREKHRGRYKNIERL